MLKRLLQYILRPRLSNKYLKRLSVIAFLSCSLIPLTDNKANHAEIENPIYIAINNWTSQIAMSEVYRLVLEKVGYRAVFAPVDVAQQWGALGRGRIHVQVEVWEGSQSHQFKQMMNTGLIISAGTHRATTQEEWWYPDYVSELCPGLPDWKALKACAQIFEGSSDPDKGLYITGPWDKFEQFRIIALDLPFSIRRLGNSNELREVIKDHIEKKLPILVYNWSPNWTDHYYTGQFVKFPDYSQDCATDPTWGINPKLAYDCGNPIDGWLKKVVWRGFPAKWPCAYKILQKLEANNTMVEELSRLVNIDGFTTRQAAQKWLDKHPKKWAKWLEGPCSSHMQNE